MDLNADFTRRAVVHGARVPWVASPMPGVERRMLDRLGDEVARATTIVRYAPGSHFAAHVHSGGEEIFVLEGTFQDEHGDYPAGSYFRNPPQSSHTPRSDEGCVILVKLWQFDRQDRTHVNIDSTKIAPMVDAARPGVRIQPLFGDRREEVRIELWAPDREVTLADHEGLELLVLEGSFSDGGEDFTPMSWLRLPPGQPLKARTGPQGARVWLKKDHLADAQTAPHR